jgi:Domain of unknown function (DUF4276)
MKFVLFVEGHTERLAVPQFLKRWLDPRLARPVGIKPVRFEGWKEYVKDIPKKVALHLSGTAGADVVACIGLLDLYGPTFYPERMVDAAARLAWAKDDLEKRVDNPRFRQYFAVHELEAWLLAAPAVLPRELRNSLPKSPPETVNFLEPPARLLDRLYLSRLDRRYRKTIDGTNLFRALDPAVAYAKCPNLKLLLDDMLRIGTEAGL